MFLFFYFSETNKRYYEILQEQNVYEATKYNGNISSIENIIAIPI